MSRFKIAAIFSDNMVLQRDKNITVFGEGPTGSTVIVRLEEQEVHTTIQNGSFKAILPPMSAGIGYTMTVSCEDETKVFHNIAIGEVWLAGGQSNMEFELKDCIDGKEMLKNDKDCNVRFYYTQKLAYKDEAFYQKEEQTEWKQFNEEAAANWSAVGYLYGKQLAKELGVVVGIIGCNWGGTSASNWMKKEYLAEDDKLHKYIADYEAVIGDKTEEEQLKEYQEYKEYQVVWDKRMNECYAKNPDITWNQVQEICGDCQWPGPLCYVHPYRPSGLYDCMLKRIIPYTLRGFIFYQGESDSDKCQLYYRLFTKMIQNWREDWEDLQLPFLFAQLPMHQYKDDTDDKRWAKIREAQLEAYQTIKNTGMAVCIDCGVYNDIHPKEKRTVAKRLALQALYYVYHKTKEEDVFGPMYHSMRINKDQVELYFEHAEQGFMLQNNAMDFLTSAGFEIAGEDKVYYPANAVIDKNRIIVKSSFVLEPYYVRYCFSNYGNVSLYGANGIPLAPFRTSKADE